MDLANGMLAGGMGEVKLDVPVAEMTYTLPTPAMATGDCGSSQTVLEGEFVYPLLLFPSFPPGPPTFPSCCFFVGCLLVVDLVVCYLSYLQHVFFLCFV